MEDLTSCDICTTEFSSGQHDPLVLMCGHTFCRSCLSNISRQSGCYLSCPTCRNEDYVNVGNLPVNYKLLGFKAQPNEPKHGDCPLHGDEMTYWCKTCQTPLCNLCIFKSHPQEHEVVKGKFFLQEKKQNLKTQTEEWKRCIKASIGKRSQNILIELKKLSSNKTLFLKDSSSMDELLAGITSDVSYESIHDVETKLNQLMYNVDKPQIAEMLAEGISMDAELNEECSRAYETLEDGSFVSAVTEALLDMRDQADEESATSPNTCSCPLHGILHHRRSILRRRGAFNYLLGNHDSDY